MGFNDVEGRDWQDLFPGIKGRTFWGDKMLVMHVEIEKGTVAPRHSHPHEQGGTVVSGEIKFIIDDETRILKAGDSYIVPGDVEHEVEAITDCTLFEIFSPVREEYKF